ncbi:AAA family ATPase [Vreelandella venusta]|uniref:AAA family ATPase n=1 Tax=Vreelandella venusta TaxID=44935 RepID=UPI00384B1A74
MPPIIIGIIGPIRAGKTTSSKYICKKYNYQLASNSSLLSQILNNMNIPTTRYNLAKLGDSIFEVMGNDIIARHRIAHHKSHDTMVIDGIRYIEEVEYYRKTSRFKLLGISCLEQIRFNRALQKNHTGKDLNLTINSFREISANRSESNIPLLMSRADSIIENNTSLAELGKKIDIIMSKWT